MRRSGQRKFASTANVHIRIQGAGTDGASGLKAIRDAEVFDTLKAVVFPALLKDRASGVPIRIWVPGCSTGEEAYSIAMCLLESMEAAAFAESLSRNTGMHAAPLG